MFINYYYISTDKLEIFLVEGLLVKCLEDERYQDNKRD